ncbi:LysR substrate-binding domain-containing protein [Poseidonocella sp. HB161398]|uniref:LysR substrate-binding domain-containing protein n=1 Tax=Poseidonocella sp. HB161398 TaxID=2320855 RepID=UPI001F1075F0|nr:LysR substrate-binding domain-containing protein [Poseidonocella sp. HB161398]
MTESLIGGLAAGRTDLALIALPFDTGAPELTELFAGGCQLASPPGRPAPAGAEALAEGGQLMRLETGHCLQRHAPAADPGRIRTAEDSFAATSLAALVARLGEGITLPPQPAIRAGVEVTAGLRLTPLPDACPRRVALAWHPGAARTALFRKPRARRVPGPDFAAPQGALGHPAPGAGGGSGRSAEGHLRPAGFPGP